MQSNSAFRRSKLYVIVPLLLALVILLVVPAAGFAQNPREQAGGEANLILPDLNQVTFLGIGGGALLTWGLGICVLGLLFGLLTYMQLRDLPVHATMREVSELIWETCKTYLYTQGKFIVILEALIAAIIVCYFGYFRDFSAVKVTVILLFSVVGLS